jgi:hypothetical protein
MFLTGACGACACPASAADDQEAFKLVVPRVGLVGSAVVLGPHHKDYLTTADGIKAMEAGLESDFLKKLLLLLVAGTLSEEAASGWPEHAHARTRCTPHSQNFNFNFNR